MADDDTQEDLSVVTGNGWMDGGEDVAQHAAGGYPAERLVKLR
jgi:hypothetical protein